MRISLLLLYCEPQRRRGHREEFVPLCPLCSRTASRGDTEATNHTDADDVKRHRNSVSSVPLWFVARAHTRTGVRVRLRSFSTTPGKTPATRSTSASVFAAPRLNRIEFCVRCTGRPIALSTCDGSSVPDEQAEPVDTAIPARSSAINSDSASTRSKLILLVFGTRGERAPLI